MAEEILDVNALDIVWLGRQGENDTRQVEIDCSEWLTQLPGCELMIAAKRNGEDALYLPTVSAADGVITWPVLSQDTLKAGYGQAEVRAMLSGKIKKSKIFRTQVDRALDGPEGQAGTLPDWVDEVRGAVAEAEQAAQNAEQAALEALEVNTDAAVRHDVSQALSEADRARARANIGAAGAQDNILFSLGSLTAGGEDVPLTVEVYSHMGPFEAGQVYTLLAGSVTGAESDESCLCLILKDGDGAVIRRVYGGISGTCTAEIAGTDLSAGLQEIVCAFSPAQTAALSGSAVVTGLQMVLGTEPVFTPSAAFSAWIGGTYPVATEEETREYLGI